MTEGRPRRRVACRVHRFTVLAALATVAALAGCDRTPRLIPAGADSTAVMTADSMAIYVQLARTGWESADGGDEAAQLTTRLLVDDLRARPDAPPGERARDFIDSLGMGAEVVGRDLAVINLFSRSDPAGGSWPVLLWRDHGSLRHQPLEARGLHLAGVAAEQQEGADEAGPRRIAVLFSRSVPLGQQPFAFVWQRPPGAARWRLAQSLGADSLGQVGAARIFEAGPGEVVLETRTYSIARGFDECASCPHVVRSRKLRWGGPGLVLASDEVERGSYPVFVQFIQALRAGDRAAAEQLVTDSWLVDEANDLGWGQSKGAWRLAPGSAPNARDLLMLRGAQQAFRVHFSIRGDDWVINGFEAATRSVE